METMKTEQIIFRCSRNLKEQIKFMAKSENQSISDIIRHICANWIDADMRLK